MYTIFVRNWWREERGRLVPDPGARRTKIGTAGTYEDAQRQCAEYNKTHKPGKLSRNHRNIATKYTVFFFTKNLN